MQPKGEKKKKKQGFFCDLRVVWFQKVILINWFFFLKILTLIWWYC